MELLTANKMYIMLGKRIKDLREYQGITQRELADRAQLSEKEFAQIEQDNVEQLPSSTLLKIADGLKLKKATDFASLVKLNRVTRRFHSYCVGLPKTGTVSMTGIFGNYRSAHEMRQWETHQMIIRFNQGSISKHEFLNFLRERDVNGMLEMDSAHFNRHYLQYLVDEFPNASFICLIRDCYSWVNSFINYFIDPRRSALQSQELSNGMPFDLPQGDCEAKKELVKNFRKYIDGPLSFWADSYRKMLNELPVGRSLVIRTNELSHKIDEIGKLVSVSSGTLIREKSHLNQSTYRINILECYDMNFLKDKFDEHCSKLMDAWFPGYSLVDFLEKNAYLSSV